MRRRLVTILVAGMLMLSVGATSALAGQGNPSPTGTGQPSQSCEDSQPGPPGFDSPGFANAEAQYANPDSQGGTASGNVHVVAQYDVACYQFSQSHT
jgi:hypothetical protein